MPIAESSASLLVATCLGALASLLAAVMPDPAAVAGIVIMDDSRLRLICIAGSLGGSVLSVVLFKVVTHQELARKLAGSSLSGVIFSPIIVRYLGVAVSTDFVLVISAVTALLSWTILPTVVPLVSDLIVGKFRRKPEATPPAD